MLLAGRRCTPGQEFADYQREWRSMHQEVENIERPGQLAIGQHAQLLDKMRFRTKRRQAEADGHRQQ